MYRLSGHTIIQCDSTVCYLPVSKTDTCFSRSGPFSSSHHPINLGLNSHACVTMAMLGEWQLLCHFHFVPWRESINDVCGLADLPETAN